LCGEHKACVKEKKDDSIGVKFPDRNQETHCNWGVQRNNRGREGPRPAANVEEDFRSGVWGKASKNRSYERTSAEKRERGGRASQNGGKKDDAPR